jgi:hypothetical protein
MQVRVRVPAQPAQVRLGGEVVLAPRDALLRGRVERLYADLELQGRGWEPCNQGPEPLGKVVRNEFEVKEWRVVRVRRNQFQEELENA